MNSHIPLAERIRPTSLDELLGQEHLVGNGSILRKAIENGKIPSMIFWGPPGTGKTTIANIIANSLTAPFFQLSAISAGVKDVREIIELAKTKPGAILFIDEIHRFNKGQQDALLGAVEKGIITLIGATTENPSFEVNSALLSRCQVYVLKSLNEEQLIKLLQIAIAKDEILKTKNIKLEETTALINISGGDGRKILNLLEIVSDAFSSADSLVITDKIVMEVAQKRIALYDKSGEQHYDIISAFIKSVRGSDPNAAIYWLARMIEGGEDVKFIARRLVILASEDIGNANPTAIVMANTCFDAVTKIGYPEANIILSQCTAYLASSPKSNAAVAAIGAALSAVKKHGDLPVPLHIRNAPTKLMKNMDYGKNYEYSHSYENSFSPQEYLPEQIAGTKFYEPGKNAREDELRKFLKTLWKNKYNY
ncbi:MAG: replication-associated recombination protein A [Chitinophagaceae bacterium]|nr:replication-associated recombination protein A [Chitinophagaceae bacterium]MBK8608200.1 replication-associated recombination protein A [Chitinophagaceae bacterium]MBP6477456.1 replication-associated recombination protein A [Chitinophagaceae bacterium]MBP7109199.1 replication-associated recombination protein A [Chitinophagaceae bacterium]MBP7313914.1 replication-associated recombination protein A [Chitinophagaceae bacterium]